MNDYEADATYNYTTVTMRAGTVEQFDAVVARCEARRSQRCRLPKDHMDGHRHWGDGVVTAWNDLKACLC